MTLYIILRHVDVIDHTLFLTYYFYSFLYLDVYQFHFDCGRKVRLFQF